MPGRTEGTAGHALGGLLEVGVVHDNDRVLAAHLQLHLAKTLRGLCVQAPPHRVRAGEGDRFHPLVVDDRAREGIARSEDHVQYALRDASIDKALDHLRRTERCQGRRLEHDGVPGDERGRDLPRRNGDWEIPRGYAGDHAERVANRIDERAALRRRDRLAVEAQALTGRESDVRDGAIYLGERFGEGLPLLLREKTRELHAPKLHQVRGLSDHVAPLGCGCPAPLLIRGRGGVDRLDHILRPRDGRVAERFAAASWIHVADVLARGRLHPHAADVVQGGACRGRGHYGFTMSSYMSGLRSR